MEYCEECNEVHGYDLGDRVRLVQNHLLTGQVINERGWGAEYEVRLGVTVTSLWFKVEEIEPDPDFYDIAKAKTPRAEDKDESAEVIDLVAARAKGRG